MVQVPGVTSTNFCLRHFVCQKEFLGIGLFGLEKPVNLQRWVIVVENCLTTSSATPFQDL